MPLNVEITPSDNVLQMFGPQETESVEKSIKKIQKQILTCSIAAHTP